MSDLSLELQLDLERQETLFLLLKSFINASVLRRDEIASSVLQLETILEVCVRDNKFLGELELWYLASAQKNQKQGDVKFTLDWNTHSVEIASGNNKFTISRDDVLGSISPVFRDLADKIRQRCLRDGVNSITWLVTFTADVGDELRWQLNRQLGLAANKEERENAMARLSSINKEFHGSAREGIVVRVSEMHEVSVQATWKRQ